MKCGVVVFPGSNCDHDLYHAMGHVLGQEATFLWHQNDSIDGCDFVLLPGGFSYGDYLRAGSMAAVSPVMNAVRRFAEQGGPILGICNGFQILLESGLLPGAMRRNRDLRFLSCDVHVRVERTDLPFTCRLGEGEVLRIPIAHAEGNYVDTEERLDQLEAAGQVVFRYCDADGHVDAASSSNPNGSERAIAGICSASGNVCALMPHPERCAEEILGKTDGLRLLEGVIHSVAETGQVLSRRPDLQSAGATS